MPGSNRVWSVNSRPTHEGGALCHLETSPFSSGQYRRHKVIHEEARGAPGMLAAEQFRNAILNAGLIRPQVIEAGPFYRFPGLGKDDGNTAGWCRLFPGGESGVFGDYSRNLTEQWQASRRRAPTAAEREAFRQRVDRARTEADATRRAEQADAARAAAAMWEAAQVAPPSFATWHVSASNRTARESRPTAAWSFRCASMASCTRCNSLRPTA